MARVNDDELRKIRSMHFTRAFEYVAMMLKLTQGKLAEKIGSKNAYISVYKSGVRPVPEEIIDNFIRISASKPGLQIYKEYLLGNSNIMLLSNLTEEEIAEVEFRKNNPDYKILKEKSEPQKSSGNTDIDVIVEHAIKAATSYADKTIENLERRISEKDKYIASLESSVNELRLLLAAKNTKSINNYQLEMGVSDNFINNK
jgi:hypothetical protein